MGGRVASCTKRREGFVPVELAALALGLYAAVVGDAEQDVGGALAGEVLAEAVRAVRRGEADQAYFLNPTRIDQVCAVADAGDRMPPKSTFFAPKPMTGLVMHRLDGRRQRP